MTETVKSGIAGCIGTLAVIGLVLLVSPRGGTPVVAVAPTDLAATPAAASNSSTFHLDFGEQLAASNCNGSGAPIVNVSQKISNDADSGTAGNYWGLDTFSRTIQVWKTGDKSYCAMVRYEGKFAGVVGQTSPGNTGTLTGNEAGTITGGYKATITNATLLTKPEWKTNGSVGSTDYMCDSSGNCPGAINWVDQYFAPGYNFDQPWWGWIYRAGGNKVWVNASSGNQGDIL